VALEQSGAVAAGKSMHHSADLICSGCFELWQKILWEYVIDHVGIGSPRIFWFLQHRFSDLEKAWAKLPAEQFYRTVEYQKTFGYVPKFKLWEGDEKKKWILCLNNNSNRVCTFLENDFCSVYESRPHICKTYPFYYDKHRVSEMKNLCPVKWLVNDEKRKQVEKDYKELLLNFLTFETICDDWNTIVKKEDKLENFLIFVKNYEL
jgi:Fe-S-cluster containining protein